MSDENNMQGKLVSDKEMDPNLTLDVKNTEVEELLKEYAKNNTAEVLNKLVAKVHKSRVLVPANVNEDKQPMPVIIVNGEGKKFFPIYTSKEQIPAEPKSQGIVNMPYIGMNSLVLREGVDVEGIVINPFSNNLIFKKSLIEKIDEVEKKQQSGVTQKQIKLTPEQYTEFERKQFEFIHLPKKIFSEGQKFIDELTDKKEDCIDQLFEVSYQQTRMYPYLPEDFSVMVMGISDDLTIFRVDFPTRDMSLGCCVRSYIAWNKSKAVARYFTIEAAKDNSLLVGEIDGDGYKNEHGPSPSEGAELQFVIDLVEKEEVTS